MLQVAVTPVKGYGKGVRLSTDGNGLLVEAVDENGDLTASNYLSEAIVRGSMGQKEISDASNIYVRVRDDGSVHSMYNKLVNSFDSKDSGFVHIAKMGHKVGGQIHIPYADSPLSEWGLRVNYDADAGAIAGPGVELIEVPLGEDSFHALANQNLPTLRVSDVETQGDHYRVTVQVVRSGNDDKRSGVAIYAKSDSGYIAQRKLLTNELGRAQFKCARLLLEDSEEFVAEFGFKFLSNITSVSL